jgi:hypothetical protein
MFKKTKTKVAVNLKMLDDGETTLLSQINR